MRVINPSGREVDVEPGNHGYEFAKNGQHGWRLADKGGAPAPPAAVVAEDETEEVPVIRRRGRKRKE